MEAARTYELVARLTKQEVKLGSSSEDVLVDEVADGDVGELADLKRDRGLILQKLGKIYSNEQYDGADTEKAIKTYKCAIKLVHGVNNKQHIALMLQSLLTSVNREHEIAQFREYLPDNN